MKLKNVFFVFALLLFRASPAQVPNSDMEDWDNQPLLLQWETNSRPLTLPPWDPYIVKQDTDRYSGKFSANLFANGLFKAYAKTTFPVSIHPNHLSLHYRLLFAPCVNDPGYPEKDTVSVLLELLKGGLVVDSGFWEETQSSIYWNTLSLSLSQNASQFDSCRITLMGGKVLGGCGFAPASTEFKVDHLEMKYSADTACFNLAQVCDTCACIALYAPVCGCDGKNYSNSCIAYNSGVTSWSEGLCSTDSCKYKAEVINTFECLLIKEFQSGTVFEVCNSVAPYIRMGDTILYDYRQSACASVCMMEHQIDITCVQIIGSADTSKCIDSSRICLSCLCSAEYEPVCGCDGITYPNACQAGYWHGVKQYYPGVCIGTGIDYQNDDANQLFLYPVPVNDVLLINYESASDLNAEFCILDALGQRVKFKSSGFDSHGTHQLEWNVSDLPAGFYFVSLTQGNMVTTKKMIKE